MGRKNDDIIKRVYKEWKKAKCGQEGEHPDEETLACYIEGRLSIEKTKEIEEHFTRCMKCPEILFFNSAIGEGLPEKTPQAFIDKAKGLVKDKALVFEIAAQIKNGVLELISASGDILIDQELVPVSLLRSRNIKGFKDEVTLFKDLKDIRVELKIRVKPARKALLEVSANDRYTGRPLKEIRVSLLKDGVEMESYLSDTGKASFENIRFGRYEIDITGPKGSSGIIILDLNV